MATLEVRNICKHFGGSTALDDVSLDLQQGKILCCLGPSGCGKTTLLRIIAGLERPDSGSVFYDGADMAGIAPHKRRFGMMFQDFALFPHKNVFENVAFGLRMQKLPGREIASRTGEVLEIVGLSGFERRDTGNLSGGERQRVALARSIAPRPRLLMLDEPLGSLDRSLRERLMGELRRILKQAEVTAVFVTHDQSEAFAAGDVIAVFSKGRIRQVASPETLFQRPADSYTARFLGFTNILDGSCRKDGGVQTGIGPLYPDGVPAAGEGKATVLIRPDAARFGLPALDGETSFPGRIKRCVFTGGSYRITFETTAGVELEFNIPSGTCRPQPGEKREIIIRSAGIVLIGP